METHDCDVAIVGGGLVGCSLALALARAGVDAVLFDDPPPARPLASDPRKLALGAAALNALAALGVLDRRPTAPTPIRSIHASREGDFGGVRLQAEDFDREVLGAVVLAGDLGRALSATLAAAAVPVRLGRAEPEALAADRRLLRLSNTADRWRARLVAAADGTASPWRQAEGIGVDTHDYGQTLLVASLRMDRPPDGRAWERLTAQGPCALLPMADGWHGGLCAVASAQAAEVLALDDAAFVAYFQRRFGWRAGRVREAGPRSAWPLRRSVARRLHGERLVLLGNAAQTLHPIGAQGFNLGLRDALCLAERIAAARQHDPAADPGAPALLAEYAAQRHEDRERTLDFSDGLARISAGETVVHRLGRSLGFAALRLDAGLRAAFASGAMGFRGRVPALARGLT